MGTKRAQRIFICLVLTVATLVAALFPACAQRFLDGVLFTTESFAPLGDQNAVDQGLYIARGMAGSDPVALAHVRALAERSSLGAAAAGGPGADGA